MKTKNQIKSEVDNYLNKTSNHLFVKENGEFYKILIEGDDFITIDGDKITTNSINYYISKYNGNAKCMIKHNLFLNKKLKSIKNFKTMRDKFSKIKEEIVGKSDKNEIVKPIIQHLSTSIKEEKRSFISKLFGR